MIVKWLHNNGPKVTNKSYTNFNTREKRLQFQLERKNAPVVRRISDVYFFLCLIGRLAFVFSSSSFSRVWSVRIFYWRGIKCVHEAKMGIHFNLLGILIENVNVLYCLTSSICMHSKFAHIPIAINVNALRPGCTIKVNRSFNVCTLFDCNACVDYLWCMCVCVVPVWPTIE